LAWNGETYVLRETLESIQEDDNLTLIGEIPVPVDARIDAPIKSGKDLFEEMVYGTDAVRKRQRKEELEHAHQLAAIRAGSESSASPSTETERPPLPRLLCDQIDLVLYKVDKRHYRELAAMQVPNEIPSGDPHPPKMPAQLLNQLQWYASVLFTREVEQYGSFRRDARYEVWLSRLADRIVGRVVGAVDQVDKGNNMASLKYHGLSQDEMVAGVREILSALVRKYVWEQSPEFLKMKAQMAESPTVQAVPAPLPAAADDTHVQTDRKALRDSCREMFPDVKIADIIWAARQTRREWTRWISGEAKNGLKPDRSFKHVLTSGREARKS
jgi:hypothetical protein